MRKWLFFLLMMGSVWADCVDPVPLNRSDSVPPNFCFGNDEYLSGYVQSLLDMHYYEYEVKVLVRNGCAYLFNLPCNQLISESIICFVGDVPCIDKVTPVASSDEVPCCYQNPEDGMAYLEMCQLPDPCCRIHGIWFPNSVLFAPLIADPRVVTNSASIRFNDTTIGKHVGACSFGDDFTIFRWHDVFRWHGDLQFDIEAGTFTVFDLDNPEACHVNTDFFVAAMFSYALDCTSFRFRLWHLSSHVGDEFLVTHPGFDRRNLSNEGIDFFISYQLGRPIRIYAGVGDIYRRDKSFPQDPFYFECGSEIRVFGLRNYFDRLYMQPFLAMHFRSWQFHNWNIDQTYALGIEWSKLQGVGRKVRIFVEYHNGFCYEGQFSCEKCKYTALKFTYGW